MLYKKIDPKSGNSISNAVDVFNIQPTNVTFSGHSTHKYLTLNPTSTPPWTFKIPTGSSFVDQTKVEMVTETKLRKLNDRGERVDLAPNEAVASIQMSGSTIIKNVKLSVNGQEVSDANSMYPYRVWFDTELSYGREAKESWLEATGYRLEDSLSQDDMNNSGFQERKRLYAGSKTVQLISRINCDLWNQPSLMIPHIEMTLEVTPHDNAFVIHAPDSINAEGEIVTNDNTYVLEVESCYLLVKSLEIMDSLSLEFNAKLDKTPAVYNVRKTVLKPFFISGGRFEFNGVLETEAVPRRVTLGLVSNEAFTGSKRTSPFAFKPYGVREISVSTMGKQYPSVPYVLNYDRGHYLQAYNDTMDALGYLHSREGCCIDVDQFGIDRAIYVFNLTNSGEDEPNFELIKNAVTNINVKFSNEHAVPDSGLILIAYMEYDGLVMIDKNRSLTSDNSL